MAIVVSDASPLFALDYLGELKLLAHYYGEVLIPAAVNRELLGPLPPRKALDVRLYPFIQMVFVEQPARVADLRQTLDLGEAEAIALAVELGHLPLLIDEAMGRAVAGELGLKTIGVLAVLLAAKVDGEIPSLTGAMDRLRSGLRFRIGESLYLRFKRQAGE